MATNKKHSDTVYIVMGVVILLLLLWWWLTQPSSSSATVGPQPQSLVTIPPAPAGSTSPLSAGTVNVTFQNQPQATGISTYIPLFGFLRYGAFFG